MSVTMNNLELKYGNKEMLVDLKELKSEYEKKVVLRNRVLEIMALKEFSILRQIDDELVRECDILLERAIQRNDDDAIKKAAIEWNAARVYRDRFISAVEDGDEAEAHIPKLEERIKALDVNVEKKEKGKFR